MNQQKIKFLKNSKGFTMVEVIVIVSVLAVLAGIASLIMGDTINAAKDNKRKANAMLMNRQMSQIYALGGSVGDGVKEEDGVNTTSVETVIDSLTRTPPLKVAGITFSLEPKPDANEYVLETDNANRKFIKPKLISK